MTLDDSSPHEVKKFNGKFSGFFRNLVLKVVSLNNTCINLKKKKVNNMKKKIKVFLMSGIMFFAGSLLSLLLQNEAEAQISPCSHCDGNLNWCCSDKGVVYEYNLAAS